MKIYTHLIPLGGGVFAVLWGDCACRALAGPATPMPRNAPESSPHLDRKVARHKIRGESMFGQCHRLADCVLRQSVRKLALYRIHRPEVSATPNNLSS
jgi:hypothetical protein